MTHGADVKVVIIEKLPITSGNFRYFYKAIIGRPDKPHLPAVTDGDTVHLAEFDYGREHIERNVSLRLTWPDGDFIDAWETRRRPRDLTDEQWEEHKTKGQLATEYVRSLLPDGTKIVVLTNRDEAGTFRDLVGAVFIPQWGTGAFLDLQESLKVNGHLKE